LRALRSAIALPALAFDFFAHALLRDIDGMKSVLWVLLFGLFNEPQTAYEG